MQPRSRSRAIAALIVLVLAGCADEQDQPLAPDVHGDVAARVADPRDKAANAVDLGVPLSVAERGLGSFSLTAVGSTTASIPFAPEPGPFAHRLTPCDDCVNDNVPIGFNFVFYGNTYSSVNISSNGFIEFPPGAADGCCTGRTIPLADDFNNIIAAAWTDLFPPGAPSGGGVFYETRGRAPNRYLIVAYQEVPWYQEVGTNRVTTQIILYEGTNLIEIHTANQSAGHIYTQGIENASGTQAAFVPGRVASNYGLTNDAVRFSTDVSGSWTSRAPLPTARRGMAVWAANGLLYSMGGSNSAGTVLTTVQAYNPSTNSWTNKASLPAARQTGNGAVMINGIIYLPGGNDASGLPTKTLYAYNTSTNTWSSKAQMPAFSSCGGSAVIGGKIFVFSGCTRSSTGAQTTAAFLHRYDPAANTWTTLRAAPVSHFQPVVASIGGKLYVAGGSNGTGTALSRMDMYDPTTNAWTLRAAMPTARVGAAGTGINGKLRVMGGRNGTTYLRTVEAYDPIANAWTTQASMPTPRAALGVGGVSGFLYAVGGRNAAGLVATNERFAP
jgi:N-acetylneuraminic acid mutarotase